MQSHTGRLTRLFLIAFAATTALFLTSAAAIADGSGGHGGGGHGGHGGGGHGGHGGGHVSNGGGGHGLGHDGGHQAHPGVVHLGRGLHDHHDRLPHRPHDVHLSIYHGVHHPTSYFGFGYGWRYRGYDWWDPCDPLSPRYSLSRCRWWGTYGYDGDVPGGYVYGWPSGDVYGWSAPNSWGSGPGYTGATAAAPRERSVSAPFAGLPSLNSSGVIISSDDVPMRVPLLPSSEAPDALPPLSEVSTAAADAEPDRSIKDEPQSEE